MERKCRDCKYCVPFKHLSGAICHHPKNERERSDLVGLEPKETEYNWLCEAHRETGRIEGFLFKLIYGQETCGIAGKWFEEK